MNFLLDRIFFEMQIGHTERCNVCRNTFLAHEDGCPHCGYWKTIPLLREVSSANHQRLSSDDPDFYVMFIDEIADIMHILSADSVDKVDFQEGNEEYLYWVTLINGDPCYIFPGDYSLWPRE